MTALVENHNVSAHVQLAIPALEPTHAPDQRTPPPPTESIFSPFALSLSFSAAVTKAMRAYERDRAQSRERRARADREKAGHDGHHGHHTRQRGTFAELFWLRFGAEYLSNESDEEEEEEDQESELDEKAVVEEEDLEDDPPFLTPPMTPRVEQAILDAPLAELLAVSLLRRADNLSARVDEFEVIPVARNVIALEEDVHAELDPEDPWEYVVGDTDSEDDEPTSSSAAIVRGAGLD